MSCCCEASDNESGHYIRRSLRLRLHLLPACLPPSTAPATATAAGFIVVVFMAVTSCGQRALCDCIHGNEY